MKPLRWEGLIAYVGQFEVGRIQSLPGRADELFVSMLNEFGLTPMGKYDSAIGAVDRVRNGRQMIEENWHKIERLMKS